jgi:hypothetical protein
MEHHQSAEQHDRGHPELGVAKNRKPPGFSQDGLIHGRMLVDLFQVDERTVQPSRVVEEFSWDSEGASL